MKYLIKTFLKIIFKLVLYIPSRFTNKNCIIVCGHDYEDYNGNSRFLYEYLSENSKYYIYWVTNNDFLIKYLDKKRLKYITYKNIIDMILVILKTKIIINSGNSYFNFLGLVDMIGAIKITLQHGQGPKTDYHCNSDSKETELLIEKINNFDYINFPSKFTSELNGRDSYKLPNKKIITFGYPKNDNLISIYNANKESKCDNNIKNIKDEYLKKFLKNNNINESKILLYTPTWRPYKSSGFELSMLDGYNENEFCKYLEENNLYMIFSSHPIMNIKNNINNRVINILNHETLVDINDLMIYSDILINDYSTTSVDFSITRKPQIFCLPDHQKYISHVRLDNDYLNNLPGSYVFSFKELIDLLNAVLMDNGEYSRKFRDQRINYIEKYYDVKNISSCSKFNQFINTII